MKTFSSENFTRLHTLRLDPGDYVLESINAFIKAEKIDSAVVVSGIGTLDYCVMHMVMTTGLPAVEHFEKWEDKPLEVSAISGIIADGSPHLHMVVSDHKTAFSGHLENGCRILYLGEILIAETNGFHYKRIKNEKNLQELTDKE